LEICFDGQPLIYEVADKTVMIKRKEVKGLRDHVKDFVNLLDVSGRVTDDQGIAISGATVKVKNGNQVAITDEKGNFILKGIDNDAVLIITVIGYRTLEISANGNLSNIRLEIATSKLDEVQVIAYGTTTQRFSTSHVGSISAKEIGQQPVSNPLLALQGRTPGLFIKQGSGATASPVTMTVQGLNSIGNGNEPFYVIDGVPFQPEFTGYTLMGGAISGGGGSSFNMVNPADIESISILRDADATAIYGSRAANGAILITTKRGKAGKTNVDVNLQNGWGKVTRTLNLLNTQQYLEIRKEAYKNAGQTIPISTSTPTTSNYDLTVWDQNKYTDWQKELVGGTAHYADINASVSGGNENTQFLAGYNYHRETTVYPGDLSDNKGNVHFNLSHASNDTKFKYLLSGTYLEQKNTLNATDLMGRAILMAPNFPDLYNPDGSLNWGYIPGTTIATFQNPLQYTLQQYQGNNSNFVASNT
ncbi:MAG: SusC/RagA family TonB-linked outer membrane protein, partial [Pedobacter sp.]